MNPSKSSNSVELLQSAYAAELETVENHLADWLLLCAMAVQFFINALTQMGIPLPLKL